MSAESPHRPSVGSSSPTTVTPQPVTDPTILDSVAGFINEVVPTTYSDSIDSKDQIQWARFEQLDSDESTFAPSYSSCDKVVPPSLLLVLGYYTGVQVWAIPASGEAAEIFSWRHGLVKVLRILPSPYIVGDLNALDAFESKRPLIALCDTVSPGSSTNSLSFYSLRTGEQVKLIKFKSPILDVLANKRSLAVTFSEKIAVFDAFTLEDRLSVTTCYLSPGIQPNPVALGTRWMAYAEKKLIPSRRSSGGNEGEGVQSYTATVLHAAKSLGRGLRELGETVASSLTGAQNFKPGTSPNSPQAGGMSDVPQKGIVTILDIESPSIQNAMDTRSLQPEAVVAHFTAHTEAIVALQFDPCGLLLLTADKRGHDFHLFRINPHPGGSALAAVHHLYTLHRGDTSAKVQDMCFSFDSRWVTVSTLRGTTHVFPITSYGGNIGVRTHATPHVVNKISRFHRSAGLTAEGRSNSPVCVLETPVTSSFPFHNPRFPPFPHPTVVPPLAQIRQPVYVQNLINAAPRQGRQRLPSSSDDHIALRVVACFAPPRAWIDSPPPSRESASIKQAKPVESLFVMSCHGTFVQYDLEPHHAASIPKERVCDDSPIELTVIAKAQWVLQRQPDTVDIPLPLTPQNLKYIAQTAAVSKAVKLDSNDDDWLSQVEIVTHAGPHRRLWMGPQFTFKTYTTTNGTSLSLGDAQPIDLSRSKPVNMPITKANAVLIESSSASSSEQSLLETYQKSCDEIGAAGEHQIKEDLADAMLESPGIREAGGRCVIVSMKPRSPSIAKVVNPLGTVVTVQSDDDSDVVIPEDDVILENCDEALFRPVVAPKAIIYQNNTTNKNKQYSGNIMMKSLEGNTEVAVRILKKSPELPKKSPELPKKSPESGVPTTNVECLSTTTTTTNATKPIDVEVTNSQTKTKPKKTKTESVKPKSELTKSKFEVSGATVDVPDSKPNKYTKKSGKPKPVAAAEPLGKVKPKNPVDTPIPEPIDNVPPRQPSLENTKLPQDVLEPTKQHLEKSKLQLEPLENVKPQLDILEKLNTNLLATEALKDDFPPLEEDFFSLDNTLKLENFEDAEDCGLPVFIETEEPKKLTKDKFNDQDTKDKFNDQDVLSDTTATSEENILEEKSVMKKPRKPKTKLGVKIGTTNKENTPERNFKDKENSVERELTPERTLLEKSLTSSRSKEPTPERSYSETWSSRTIQSLVPDKALKACSTEITVTPPKRTWSSIAASKQENPVKESSDEQKPVNIDVSLVESVESFTVTLPPKSYSSCFVAKNIMDVDVPSLEESTTNVDENSDMDLLKIDKSSDDEKGDTTGSSAIETTTESDDSGKVAVIADVLDDKPPATATSKSAKKKVKKKKK